MSTIRRPQRRQRPQRRRQSFLKGPGQRLLCGAEPLEPRTMLAGDLPSLSVSEFWNYKQPTDINNDGHVSTLDLLPLINNLTVGGPRRLGSSQAAGEGEGASSGRFFIDPNNDGMLNTLDLLSVINDLSAEGEGDPPLINFSFVPVTEGTNDVIASIPEGGYYDLRVMVQDTGILSFMGDTRTALQTNGNSALGLFTAFLDMFWDRNQTDLQVSETQQIEILGSPVSGGATPTKLKLTFTDIDNSTQQTADITYTNVKETMAVRIRDALVALSKIGTTGAANGNLPNVEVEPVTNKKFLVRFINDKANKDFANLIGAITVPGSPGGATGVTVTQTVAGDPNSLASFQEMFRPRNVRNSADAFDIINDDVNDLLYYGNYTGLGDHPAANPFAGGVHNAGGNNGPVLADFTGPRPGTQVVEMFRLRMTAKDSLGTGGVVFSGAYPDVSSNLFETLLGDASPNSGAFSNAIPANVVMFSSANLAITEPISAIDDAATLNEGTNGGSLNSVAIDVLGPPGVAGSDQDNTGPYNLVLITTPILPGGFQGTVTARTAGQDGIPRAHFLYTVPTADFNGVVTFQYTIRDGITTTLTDTGTVTVTVKAFNDPPQNSIGGVTNFASKPQTVAEDAPLGLVFSGANSNSLSISDVDAASGNVQVNLVATNGVLNMASLPGTLTITGDGTANLQIVGAIANINPALSGLKYTPNHNFNGAAQITMTTDDQGNSGDPPNNGALTDVDVIGITVTPVNDPPVNAVPGAQQVDESFALAFTGGNTISISDVDAGAGNMTVNLATNSTQGGLLSATQVAGSTVTGNNSQSLTISGTLTAVNNALTTLVFTAGLPETLTLVVTTSDNGNTPAPAQSDVDNVSITVNATVRPRAVLDTINVAEGPASFDLIVLANDLHHLTSLPTLETIGVPSVGTAVRNDHGTVGDLRDDTITYTPPSVDFFGQVTFTYTISEDPFIPGGPPDGTVLGANATALVTLNIANTPDTPVADDDGPYAATEDVALNVNAASGVLNGDTDADNLSAPFNAGLTAVLTQQPPAGQGTVNLAADGSFTWTPTAGANFTGTTTFKYQARDPQNNMSSEATVTIEVAPVNDAPVAVNDGPGGLYQTNEDIPLNIVAPGVLSNDTDVDSPAGDLTAELTVLPLASQGTVTLQPNGSFLFSPFMDFNGTATFKYRVHDNNSTDPKVSNEATVSITVVPVNDPPVAHPATYQVEESQTLVVPVNLGLRAAVTDPDQPSGFTGSIALGAVTPAQGTLNLAADGSFTFTAPTTVLSDFDVFFSYTASDGLSTSNEATVTIHVTQFNDPPVAVDDGPPYTIAEDSVTPLTVAAPGVLQNDFDEETANANLQAVLVSNVPAGAGNVVLQLNGSFVYTPALNFFTTPGNPISFTYQTRDEGLKLSNVATVRINVTEVNDDPIARDDFRSPLIKNFSNQLITPSPLANDDSGPDATVSPAEVLTITAVNGNATSATTVFGNTVRLVSGQIFFDETAGTVGQDSFQYTISDGRGGTATATVTLDVVDFLPKDISGKVFVDADNDGVLDAGEHAVANAEIHLNGTNVLGIATFAQLVAFTDADGNYSFTGLRPGNYTLTEVQPLYLRDGSEPGSVSSPLVTSIQDDHFQMVWDVPLSISTGAITGLNFGERGIDPTQLADSSGLITEILASSGSSGMLLAVDSSGHTIWSYCLSGWNTLATLQLEFGAGGSIPSALLTIGGVTKRIYQDPHNNHGGNTPPSGSMARFRVLGTSGTGDYIIRLDGTLGDFGFAFAPPPQDAGEGEAGPPMSDGQYQQSADAVFAEKSWA